MPKISPNIGGLWVRMYDAYHKILHISYFELTNTTQNKLKQDLSFKSFFFSLFFTC